MQYADEGVDVYANSIIHSDGNCQKHLGYVHTDSES